VSPCLEALASALAQHHATDAAEMAHLSRMRALLDQGAGCLSRSHFVPGHITASAFILSPREDALLLIHHEKLLRWLQPGGHLEASDASPLAAARREAHEEVGLSELEMLGRGIFDLDVHAIPSRKDEPAHEHFDVRFLFRAQRTDVRADSDAMDARFFPLEQFAAQHTDASVLRALEKLRDR
jgi:8-oxo-dGTP pyrophosphatase MutT (NUDIX family)